MEYKNIKYSSESDSDSDEEDRKIMKTDISNIKNSLQKYTLDIVENIQRKFMEMNWYPYNGDMLSNQRISHQMEEWKRKHGNENKEILDTVFLTSFGVLGIYIFYKMLQKN